MGTELPDIGWYTPAGDAMTEQDWSVSYAKSLGIFLNGSAPLGRDRFGRELTDDSFFVLMNAWAAPLSFRMPETLTRYRWESVFDTARVGREFSSQPVLTDRTVDTAGRSVQLLRCLDPVAGVPYDYDHSDDLL